MGKDARSKKDKERAAYMKRHGIERTTGRCSVCYRIVPNGTSHFYKCSK